MRHRKGAPYFTDKMPNNFPTIGLLSLILPNAKIINTRKNPVDSCLGCFKQHFAKWQAFTYDLNELREFYLEYANMMDHWHAVLPGKVLDVQYEDMVQDQETQTRRLLEFCGLPWEESASGFMKQIGRLELQAQSRCDSPFIANLLVTGKIMRNICSL